MKPLLTPLGALSANPLLLAIEAECEINDHLLPLTNALEGLGKDLEQTPRPHCRPPPKPASFRPLKTRPPPPSSSPPFPSTQRRVIYTPERPEGVPIDAEDPLLRDLPADFLNIDSFDRPPASPPSSPFLGATQPLARLTSYIARHPYTEEPLRHGLGPMDQICDSCDAASFRDETPRWCCNSGKTEVVAPETDVPQEEDQDDDEDDQRGVETTVNDPINPSERNLNNILHSVKPGTFTLTDECKAYPEHSVQYNNAASIASQQVTINHSVAPFTCKVQGAITTHMPALAPPEGEKSVFGQIYIMDSTQEQSITR